METLEHARYWAVRIAHRIVPSTGVADFQRDLDAVLGDIGTILRTPIDVAPVAGAGEGADA